MRFAVACAFFLITRGDFWEEEAQFQSFTGSIRVCNAMKRSGTGSSKRGVSSSTQCHGGDQVHLTTLLWMKCRPSSAKREINLDDSEGVRVAQLGRGQVDEQVIVSSSARPQDRLGFASGSTT